MLHWVGAAIAGGGLILAARWTIAWKLGRPVPSFPWRGVMIPIVIGCLLAVPWFLRTRLEGRLSDAASQVAGRDVFVQCQSFSAALVDPSADLGHVAYNANGQAEPKTLIKRDQCKELADYLGSDKLDPSRDEIVAVHVLTHESIHMSGVVVEADAECLAMSQNERMARLLGAPPEAARQLALDYWRDVYPDMPSEYRSSDCDPGFDEAAR
jgi:hypothetical protein